jgi:hypothetical protein
MMLSSTSHGLEICNTLDILKQSNDEEVCNCDSGSETDASDTDGVSSVINSDNEENEEETLVDARV